MSNEGERELGSRASLDPRREDRVRLTAFPMDHGGLLGGTEFTAALDGLTASMDRLNSFDLGSRIEVGGWSAPTIHGSQLGQAEIARAFGGLAASVDRLSSLDLTSKIEVGAFSSRKIYGSLLGETEASAAFSGLGASVDRLSSLDFASKIEVGAFSSRTIYRNLLGETEASAAFSGFAASVDRLSSLDFTSKIEVGAFSSPTIYGSLLGETEISGAFSSFATSAGQISGPGDVLPPAAWGYLTDERLREPVWEVPTRTRPLPAPERRPTLYDDVRNTLSRLDVSADLVEMWDGAWSALELRGPDYGRHVMISLRGLMDSLLRGLAPNHVLEAWSRTYGYVDERGRPTRRARILYVKISFSGVSVRDVDNETTGQAVAEYRGLNRLHADSLDWDLDAFRALVERCGKIVLWLLKPDAEGMN